MSASAVLRAEADPRLEARIVRRVPLLYAEGACPAEDRPAFVRAASGICACGDELVVVQDDSSFLAFVRPDGRARAVPLPRGPGGRRQFAERDGNKLDKLDLEACVVVPTPGGSAVLAFGSGSLPIRERLVILDPARPDGARVVDAHAFYARLHAEPRLSGGELNVEGVALVGDRLRLFQRGNGERPGSMPAPATIEVDLAELLRWAGDPSGEPPALHDPVRYDLGAEDGARFGFTDAAFLGDSRVAYLASAERSPDAIRDGEVLGSRIGWTDGREARWTPLLDEGGLPARIKAEGIALDPSDDSRAWIVLDPDDPDRPAELCETRLRGPWCG